MNVMNIVFTSHVTMVPLHSMRFKMGTIKSEALSEIVAHM